MLTNNEAHRFFHFAAAKPLSFLTVARATWWPSSSSKLSLRKHFLHQPIVRPSQWLEPLEEAVPCEDEERGECGELEGERERDGLLLLNLFLHGGTPDDEDFSLPHSFLSPRPD